MKSAASGFRVQRLVLSLFSGMNETFVGRAQPVEADRFTRRPPQRGAPIRGARILFGGRELFREHLGEVVRPRCFRKWTPVIRTSMTRKIGPSMFAARSIHVRRSVHSFS